MVHLHTDQLGAGARSRSDLRTRLYLEADRKAEALTQTCPQFCEQLNQEDIERILVSLDFHFEDTENRVEADRNRAVTKKVLALNEKHLQASAGAVPDDDGSQARARRRGRTSGLTG